MELIAELVVVASLVVVLVNLFDVEVTGGLIVVDGNDVLVAGGGGGGLLVVLGITVTVIVVVFRLSSSHNAWTKPPFCALASSEPTCASTALHFRRMLTSTLSRSLMQDLEHGFPLIKSSKPQPSIGVL